MLADGTAVAADGGPVPTVSGSRRDAVAGAGPAQPVSGGPATTPMPPAACSRASWLRRRRRQRYHEFTRVLSPQNFLLLLGLTAVAALI